MWLSTPGFYSSCCDITHLSCLSIIFCHCYHQLFCLWSYTRHIGLKSQPLPHDHVDDWLEKNTKRNCVTWSRCYHMLDCGQFSDRVAEPPVCVPGCQILSSLIPVSPRHTRSSLASWVMPKVSLPQTPSKTKWHIDCLWEKTGGKKGFEFCYPGWKLCAWFHLDLRFFWDFLTLPSMSCKGSECVMLICLSHQALPKLKYLTSRLDNFADKSLGCWLFVISFCFDIAIPLRGHFCLAHEIFSKLSCHPNLTPNYSQFVTLPWWRLDWCLNGHLYTLRRLFAHFSIAP